MRRATKQERQQRKPEDRWGGLDLRLSQFEVESFPNTIAVELVAHAAGQWVWEWELAS
jgi:hypothetical protein